MSIEMSQADYDTIVRQGEETFPHECCGFILGTAEGDDKKGVELRPAINSREEEARKNRFEITPDNYREAEKYGREQALDIIGIYHSHPNAPARPSEFDREHAWPWLSYVIVSILERRADAMTSWILQDDRTKFNEEKINIAEQ